MSESRWQSGAGPGHRRLPFNTRVKRWLVDWAARDQRIRRMALNRIFSDYATNGILCLVPFADHKVFVDPRDDRIAYTLLSGRSWQRAHLDAGLNAAEAADRLAPNGIFVDVGANIGLITLYAMLTGRFSRAIAIEPDPWNRAILQQNLEINGLHDRVTVIAKAASDKAGTMNLHRDAKNLGAHSLEEGFSMSPVETAHPVEVQRLDTILAEHNVAATDIGFIKIDVEGHEFAALRGLAGLVTTRPPIMVEVTFDAADGRAEMEQLRHLLPQYTHIVDIENARPVSMPLDAFQPTAGQHELLIF